MSPNITPENEDFMTEQISAGHFTDRDEALNAGIELLKARQELLERLAVSRNELDSGQYQEFDDVGLKKFFDELRAPRSPKVR